MTDLTWRKQANCAGVGTRLFFPERGMTAARAKAVCLGCVVQESCLQEALDREEEFGIWGGRSVQEREAILGYRLVRGYRSSTDRRTG